MRSRDEAARAGGGAAGGAASGGLGARYGAASGGRCRPVLGARHGAPFPTGAWSDPGWKPTLRGEGGRALPRALDTVAPDTAPLPVRLERGAVASAAEPRRGDGALGGAPSRALDSAPSRALEGAPYRALSDASYRALGGDVPSLCARGALERRTASAGAACRERIASADV